MEDLDRCYRFLKINVLNAKEFSFGADCLFSITETFVILLYIQLQK